MQELVRAELWEVKPFGFEFHDWLVYQLSREYVLAERASNAARQAVSRNPDLREAVRARDGDNCRYCGLRVGWSDRRGNKGGTYDHVDPTGPSVVDNLVVSCRGCNSSKGRRTPQEAGLVLIQIEARSDLGTNLDPTSSELGSEPESDLKHGGSSYLDHPAKSDLDKNKTVRDPRPDPTRPDLLKEKDKEHVDALCALLSELIVGNGSKRPTIGKGWLNAARLMLTADARDPVAAERLMRWCQADSFWKANVMSMPTFRKNYDRLRLAANKSIADKARPGGRPTPEQRAMQTLSLATQTDEREIGA
ncbi:HNH endonuclease [Cryobacterium psychrophilum]|uniref:HNH endonuclease n=1 Tax=Cryobacterium psychrophilum TaxID=41988 RepID=A0A4Y8KUP2_9MICO|nr:HNH endonuclease signature motif containing protein [Cryobacterium psychrophilum]TFD80855.1 HNH endonuclease [Cryobacterium psychrophilum]